MAKFQIYTYMFRPVMENKMEIPFEEFQKIDVQDSLDRKQELTSEVLDNNEKLKFKFNTVEYAKQLQQNGGFIPGIRPGKPTSDYIAKVLSKITLMGAFFLGFVAIEPFIFSDLTYMYQTTFLGGTSVIIMVGVALETVKQMESQMMMRHYKGFLD